MKTAGQELAEIEVTMGNLQEWPRLGPRSGTPATPGRSESGSENCGNRQRFSPATTLIAAGATQRQAWCWVLYLCPVINRHTVLSRAAQRQGTSPLLSGRAGFVCWVHHL